MSPLIRGLLASALTLLVLAGCRSQPTRLFTIQAVTRGPGYPSYQGPVVRVDAVHVPPGLDRTELMWTIAPGELQIDDFAYWSAPLAQLARRALSADLIALFPPGTVLFPDLPKPADALGVEVDLLSMVVDRGQAQLTAGWMITAPGSDSSGERQTVTLQAPAGSGAAGVADAYGVLMGELAERIGADLAARHSARPRARAVQLLGGTG
ncbi:MAG TPA: ABC-type transport auxiliary lipoprotein family protein [Steroidobacteraceae bacterium]|nr:ABC-type transport auxiliary lipoprotein family protein [Steroidobacteraceae bacterium]